MWRCISEKEIQRRSLYWLLKTRELMVHYKKRLVRLGCIHTITMRNQMM